MIATIGLRAGLPLDATNVFSHSALVCFLGTTFKVVPIFPKIPLANT